MTYSIDHPDPNKEYPSFKDIAVIPPETAVSVDFSGFFDPTPVWRRHNLKTGEIEVISEDEVSSLWQHE